MISTVYSYGPIALKHSGGGELLISQEKVDVVLGAIVHEAGPMDSDVVEIEKKICDNEGKIHRFATFISAYDIWNEISNCEIGELVNGGEITSSRAISESSEVLTIASNLRVSSDGRQQRVFALRQEQEEGFLFFQMHEKYFEVLIDIVVTIQEGAD